MKDFFKKLLIVFAIILIKFGCKKLQTWVDKKKAELEASKEVEKETEKEITESN